MMIKLRPGSKSNTTHSDDVFHTIKKGTYTRAVAAAGSLRKRPTPTTHTYRLCMSLSVFLTQSSLYGLLLVPKTIRQRDPSAALTHTCLCKANYPQSPLQTNHE